MSNTSSHNIVKKISILIFGIYIIVANTPRFNSVTIEVALVAAWIIVRLFMGAKFRVDWRLIIFLWLLYEVALRLIGFSSSAWGNYAVHILYFFPLFAFCTYQSLLSDKEKYGLIVLYIVSIILNVAMNIYMLLRYPRYNLLLNYVDTYQGINLRSLNIGNTMFSYVIMLFAIFCLYYVCEGRRKYIIPLVIAVAYILLASKTTALLLMLVGFLYVLLKRVSNRVRLGQRVVIFVIGIGLLYIAYRFGLPFLANNIDNVSVQDRLNAIISGNYGSEYFSRIELAGLSFKTFLNHPLIGVGYELVDSKQVSLYTTGIGHHSEIIDLMGRYGIIGIFANLFIYFSFYQFTKKLQGTNRDKALGNILMLVVLIYSFLNNSISVESGLLLFYLIPSICNGDLNYMSRSQENEMPNVVARSTYE